MTLRTGQASSLFRVARAVRRELSKNGPRRRSKPAGRLEGNSESVFSRPVIEESPRGYGYIQMVQQWTIAQLQNASKRRSSTKRILLAGTISSTGSYPSYGSTQPDSTLHKYNAMGTVIIRPFMQYFLNWWITRNKALHGDMIQEKQEIQQIALDHQI